MFKVGDWVLRTRNKQYCKRFGLDPEIPHRVIKVKNKYHICLEGSKNLHRGYSTSNFDLVPVNNPLNKKLYPDRVEHEGFLLPPKIAKKINEETSCN